MVLAKTLSKKMVLMSDGTEVGMVYNVTADLKTGMLIDLIVKPGQKPLPDLEKTDNYYIIPFEAVKSISHYVVLDKKKLLKG
ncbi:hypothetical protein Asulf_02186 [Archaeoglobus sulfaticallidus PM70-1]|uniref:PRC-barrel domain-containing protein n=1 Tax=Archaeoglobus sulfaticallidus PM70-1 TaxID=387631 RepID=N0BES5_9EURY|nr:PRC-barrel domain-containing protein [Archaeoglobus sulfaticallidus]AGK62139.1 hypothetical protein Asulf_02186 [Archaeoglobus sulfaticallidus PM70-1]